MGEVVIHTDDTGAGAVVLDDAPVAEIEHVLIVRSEGENPHAQVGVVDLDGNSVRIQVAGAAPDADLTVTYDGAPNAHVAEPGSEANALDAEVAEEPEDAGAEPEAEVEEPTVADQPEVSTDLSRDDLNARAAEAGVENPEALPNKAAVVDAINAASKED